MSHPARVVNTVAPRMLSLAPSLVIVALPVAAARLPPVVIAVPFEAHLAERGRWSRRRCCGTGGAGALLAAPGPVAVGVRGVIAELSGAEASREPVAETRAAVGAGSGAAVYTMTASIPTMKPVRRVVRVRARLRVTASLQGALHLPLSMLARTRAEVVNRRLSSD